MYTPRFNPNSAVSNWKSRLDYLKGYPGAAMSGVMNGGLFGSPVEFSGGSSSVVGDYTYVTYDTSGTVTCVSGGKIDVLLVGAGGGNGAPTSGHTGGGGGGGALAGATVTVDSGDYTLTIGAAPVSGSGDNGGDSHILMAGWNLYAFGGGYGGYGGYANCAAGGSGTGNTSPLVTPYQRAGGSGGGAGVWYQYCTGGPGYGQDTTDSGTGSGGGTWSNHTAGNGWGGFNSYNNLGGGGGGAGGNTATSVDGQPGYTWLDGTVYGSGGDGGNGNTPPDDNYGSGASWNNSGSGPQTANNGVLIVRYLTDG